MYYTAIIILDDNEWMMEEIQFASFQINKKKTWIILGVWEWMMSSNILNNAIYVCKHY